MNFDLDREIALARLRIHLAIERFIAHRMSQPASVRRSIGQTYRRRRERLEKEKT